METGLEGDAIIRDTVMNEDNVRTLFGLAQGFLSLSALLFEAIAPSAVMMFGSHLNSSRLVMVHWPTTGFLPNGR